MIISVHLLELQPARLCLQRVGVLHGHDPVRGAVHDHAPRARRQGKLQLERQESVTQNHGMRTPGGARTAQNASRTSARDLEPSLK